jgi:hypothetical protein
MLPCLFFVVTQSKRMVVKVPVKAPAPVPVVKVPVQVPVTQTKRMMVKTPAVKVPVPTPVVKAPVKVPVPTPVVKVPVKAPAPVPVVKAPAKPPTNAPVQAPLPCVEATTIMIDPETQSGNVLGNTTNIETEDTVRGTTNPSCAFSYYNGFGIWYKINPFTNNANLIASTCNAGTNFYFDTVVTVYQGNNCRPQVCVAQNDNVSGCVTCGSAPSCSIIEFAVSPSTTYWIFVHGFALATGNFNLTVSGV